MEEEEELAWEAGSAASGSSSGGSSSAIEDVEISIAEEEQPRREKRKKRSASEETRYKRDRLERVAVHKAQLVVTCCRLRLVAEWSLVEMSLDAGRVIVPERVLNRLRAAGRGESVLQPSLKSLLEHVRRASSGLDERNDMGCDSRSLAERCYSNKLTASNASQIVFGFCAAQASLDAALVAAIDPCSCSPSKKKGGGVELWVRVANLFVADATCHAAPPRKPAYLVELSSNGSLLDVTAKYYESPESKLLPKSARKNWWRSKVLSAAAAAEGDGGALGSSSARSSSMMISRRLPTNRVAFRDHEHYVLRSTLTKRQKLNEGARQVAVFKGEPVYNRSDVLPLLTAREWRRRLRRVRPECQEKEEREQDEEQKRPAYRYYSESQTEPWEPDPVSEDGTLPVNDYGDVDIYDGDPNLVPNGAVWFKGKEAREAAGALEIRYAPVMTGWEAKKNGGASSLFSSRRGGGQQHAKNNVRPKRDGIVVAEKDAASLKSRLYDTARAQQRAARRAQFRATQSRWTRLVTRMTTRDRLRREYDDQD